LVYGLWFLCELAVVVSQVVCQEDSKAPLSRTLKQAIRDKGALMVHSRIWDHSASV
jgi:hypothetical protein